MIRHMRANCRNGFTSRLVFPAEHTSRPPPNGTTTTVVSVAANSAATAFRNAHLINELRNAQKVLREREQELRTARDELEIKVAERTRELRDIVDTIPAIVWRAEPDGSNAYVNSRFVEYAGMSAEQLAGSGWHAATHPDDLPRHERKWLACVRTGEVFEDEVRFRWADGQYRWHLLRGVPLRDEDGNILKWYGVLTDIGDRKRAEEALQRDEHYLVEGQRLAHMGSWVFNPAGFFSHWSSELLRIYGLEEAHRLEVHLALVHPQDLESMKSFIEQAVAQASGLDVTKGIVRHDGEVRYIRWVGAPVVEDGTLQRIVGTAIDVTEHELLSQELRRREAYLAGAQRLSHTGSFGWKPDDGEIVWSDETYSIFEYDRAEKPTMNMVFQRIHPQDRAVVQQVIDHASRSTDFEHEYRLVIPSGAIKHIHVRAHALPNSSGNIEIVGVVTDITERKTNEDKIRRLVDANILGIFIGDVEGACVAGANEAFLDMLQYSRKDLVLRRMLWADLTPPEWHERDERAMTTLKDTGAAQPYEKEFFRKDGSRVPVLVGGALFEGGNESVAFVLDLTEQKRAEEKIRKQEMELRQILDLAPQLIAVYGPNRERLYANRVALEYFGMSLDEWQQRPVGVDVRPDDFEKLKAFEDRGSSGHELELQVRKGDGSFRWFLIRFNALHDETGQLMRWYVAATDIDERRRAEEKLQQENVAFSEELDKASMFEEIVGTSVALQSVLFGIAKVSPTDSTVLITGETGSGKELVARAIHKRSNRSSGVFVGVNCAVIPHDLVASELFGHEKGAFTGAAQRRLGRFELAEGGTIFLDEVGDLPPETQVALLRVLQE
ncbi:MAG TPA: PAS domain S-box protein, partial [Edaphobacter sp.]|nr:PAS domain S-box protein [Edaphobacter sp.]